MINIKMIEESIQFIKLIFIHIKHNNYILFQSRYDCIQSPCVSDTYSGCVAIRCIRPVRPLSAHFVKIYFSNWRNDGANGSEWHERIGHHSTRTSAAIVEKSVEVLWFHCQMRKHKVFWHTGSIRPRRSNECLHRKCFQGTVTNIML